MNYHDPYRPGSARWVARRALWRWWALWAIVAAIVAGIGALTEAIR